ncbi:S-adenosyl-L-methionine-dependent methyltransferases superfamily protein [Artemisia annua]|uniref:S-adenosyl-L-methionine-dependent methyltransferases superfamily protein n=1 Tax=Artemisia annua TaxID=35608 RepID=A0A2U1LZU9_ARTAN|nr:S-adenosyl-L-methionine-dependent methyltransferases superfamily protein [Artemisia annua]
MSNLLQVPYDAMVRLLMASLEHNPLPDAVTRRLTRMLLAGRLRSCFKPTSQQLLEDLMAFVHSLQGMPIAVKTEDANGCYFSNKLSTLEDAEEAMMQRYCDKSQLKDGHTVLDIGCGWGSLSIYVAQKYSNCKITGICNSVSQKAHIEDQCVKLGLKNVEVIVGDISTFEMEGLYDRIISIGMFEHMKNYKFLLKKISNWMKADGFLFVHFFCHKTYAYHFEDDNEDDWITKYFFSGGTMPSANLLLYFQDDVSVVDHGLVNGKHYARTCEEWLKKMDKNINAIKPIMESTYGKASAVKWIAYWRTFFISIAELFAYNNGEEWMDTHYLFKKK